MEVQNEGKGSTGSYGKEWDNGWTVTYIMHLKRSRRHEEGNVLKMNAMNG